MKSLCDLSFMISVLQLDLRIWHHSLLLRIGFKGKRVRCVPSSLFYQRILPKAIGLPPAIGIPTTDVMSCFCLNSYARYNVSVMTGLFPIFMHNNHHQDSVMHSHQDTVEHCMLLWLHVHLCDTHPLDSRSHTMSHTCKPSVYIYYHLCLSKRI